MVSARPAKSQLLLLNGSSAAYVAPLLPRLNVPSSFPPPSHVQSHRGSYDDYGSSSRRIRSSSRTRGGYDSYSSDESEDYDRRSRRGNRRRSSGNYGRRSGMAMAGYAAPVPTYGGAPLAIQGGYPSSAGASYIPQTAGYPQAGYGGAYQPTYPTSATPYPTAGLGGSGGVGGFAYAPAGGATPQLSSQLVIPQTRPRAGSFSYSTQYGGY